MLVDEHPNGNAGHVEAVEEVLNAVVCLLVHGVGLLQLQHALRHGLHHVRVPVANADQSLAKPAHTHHSRQRRSADETNYSAYKTTLQNSWVFHEEHETRVGMEYLGGTPKGPHLVE